MALEYVPHPWQRAAKRTALIVLPVLLQACALCQYEDGELAYSLNASYYDSDYDTEHADHDAVYHSDRYTHSAHRKESRHGYADGRHHDRKSGRSHNNHKDKRKAGHHGREDKPKGHARSGHGNRDRKAEFSAGRRQHGGPEVARRTRNKPSPLDDSGRITVNMPSGQVRVPVASVRHHVPPKAQRKAALSRSKPVETPKRTTVQTPLGAVRLPVAIQGRDWTKASKQSPKAVSRGKARRSPKAQRKAAPSRSKPVETPKRTTVQTPLGAVRLPVAIQGRDWTKASKQSPKSISRGKAKAKPSLPSYRSLSGFSRVRR